MMKIGICGYTGKVGSSLLKELLLYPEKYRITGRYATNRTRQDFQNLFQADVVIDFSNNNLIENILDQALLYKTPLVIGTTGLTKLQHIYLQDISKQIPIIYSANMSVGANVIKLLAARAAMMLHEGYDIEISEAHQRSKKDSPSGTALEIAELIASTKGLDFIKKNIYDNPYPRTKDQIGFASIRAGAMPAEHNVMFVGENEMIEIKHRALTRKCYNAGIIKAMHWIIQKKHGLYSMLDVLETNNIY